MEPKYATEAFEKFSSFGTFQEITQQAEKIIEQQTDFAIKEAYRFLYSCIDLTTLTGTDSDQSVAQMVMEVNDLDSTSPDLSNVAAICVYPALLPVVKETLTVPNVQIASVSGGFPASQTFIEVKVAETALAVSAGATEIDVVLSVGKFLSGEYEECAQEIEELKNAARGASLKVILETGALPSPEEIKKAAILALFAGADFLKTSTGKEFPGASVEAAYVLCQVIKEYHQMYGEKKGVKFSGGIRTPQEALKYYFLVKGILGEEWLTPQLFRIGASSLAQKLREEIAKM